MDLDGRGLENIVVKEDSSVCLTMLTYLTNAEGVMVYGVCRTSTVSVVTSTLVEGASCMVALSTGSHGAMFVGQHGVTASRSLFERFLI